MRRVIAAGLLLALSAVVFAEEKEAGTSQEALASFVRTLKDKNASSLVKRQAADSLAKLGKEAKDAAPALVESLKDKDKHVRMFSAKALGAIGPDVAKTAIPGLTKALEDEDKNVSEAAAEALGKMGPAAVSVMIDNLRKKDVYARRLAAESLGKMGAEAKSAVSTLTDVTKDRDKETRLAAIRALGQIGPEAKSAVPTLTDLADREKTRDRDVRDAASMALRQIRGARR